MATLSIQIPFRSMVVSLVSPHSFMEIKKNPKKSKNSQSLQNSQFVEVAVSPTSVAKTGARCWKVHHFQTPLVCFSGVAFPWMIWILSPLGESELDDVFQLLPSDSPVLGVYLKVTLFQGVVGDLHVCDQRVTTGRGRLLFCKIMFYVTSWFIYNIITINCGDFHKQLPVRFTQKDNQSSKTFLAGAFCKQGRVNSLKNHKQLT